MKTWWSARIVVEANARKRAKADPVGVDGRGGGNRALKAKAEEAKGQKIETHVTRMINLIRRIVENRLESVQKFQRGKRRSQSWSNRTSRIIRNRVVDVEVMAAAVLAVVRVAHVEAVATAKEVRVAIVGAVTATVVLAVIAAGTTVALVATIAAMKMEAAVGIAIKTTVGAVDKEDSDWTMSDGLVESNRKIIDGAIVSAAEFFA